MKKKPTKKSAFGRSRKVITERKGNLSKRTYSKDYKANKIVKVIVLGIVVVFVIAFFLLKNKAANAQELKIAKLEAYDNRNGGRYFDPAKMFEEKETFMKLVEEGNQALEKEEFFKAVFKYRQALQYESNVALYKKLLLALEGSCNQEIEDHCQAIPKVKARLERFLEMRDKEMRKGMLSWLGWRF